MPKSRKITRLFPPSGIAVGANLYFPQWIDMGAYDEFVLIMGAGTAALRGSTEDPREMDSAGNLLHPVPTNANSIALLDFGGAAIVAQNDAATGFPVPMPRFLAIRAGGGGGTIEGYALIKTLI